MSKKVSALVAIPVLLLGAATGGAFWFRGMREDAAKAAATHFLRTVSDAGLDQAMTPAFGLTYMSSSNASSEEQAKARKEFPEKILSLGMADLQDPSCTSIERESVFLNTLTASLHTVSCSWRDGPPTKLMVVSEGGRHFVSFADVGGRGHATL